MWRYEFDETGGYDCMSAAFIVYTPSNKMAFAIDVADFITHEEELAEPDGGWDLRRVADPRAEAMARLICARLNA